MTRLRRLAALLTHPLIAIPAAVLAWLALGAGLALTGGWR